MGNETYPITYTPKQCYTVRNTIQGILDRGKLDDEQAETAKAVIRKLERCNPDLERQLYNFHEDEMLFVGAIEEALWRQ